jgi:hypothetical protein
MTRSGIDAPMAATLPTSVAIPAALKPGLRTTVGPELTPPPLSKLQSKQLFTELWVGSCAATIALPAPRPSKPKLIRITPPAIIPVLRERISGGYSGCRSNWIAPWPGAPWPGGGAV